MPEPEPTEGRGTSGIQVIARAADILRLLASAPGGLSQSELAVRLNLARTTVHRILGALEQESLVAVTHSRGRYRLGPEVTRLAEGARRDLLGSLHPLLQELSRQMHETVDLSILDGGRVTFLDQVVAPRRLQAVSAVGESFPLYACAPGKAILAALPGREIASLLPNRLPRLTLNTLSSHAALRNELSAIRDDGVAFDREEHTLGICAVAVVLDPDAPQPMAISLPMPAQRFYGREAELHDALLAARTRILSEINTEPPSTVANTTAAVPDLS